MLLVGMVIPMLQKGTLRLGKMKGPHKNTPVRSGGGRASMGHSNAKPAAVRDNETQTLSDDL